MAATRQDESNLAINGLSQEPVLGDAKEPVSKSQSKVTPLTFKNKEITVWWDYDSCPLPSNVSAMDFVGNACAFLALKKDDGSGEINNTIKFMAYTNMANIKNKTCKELMDQNIKVSSVVTERHRPGRSENVDKVIIEDMAEKEKGGENYVAVVITGDAGFTEHMLKLIQDKKIPVVLIYPKKNSSLSFINQPLWHCAVSWEDLLAPPPKPRAAVEPANSICAHYNKNVCRFPGGDCKFLHMCSSCGSKVHGAVKCPKNPEKPAMCGHFLKGNCRWGKECNLNHRCPDCGKTGEHRCLSIKCSTGPELKHDPKKVALAQNRPPAPKHCAESFYCPNGLECKLMHLPPELNCFRKNGGKGVLKVRVDDCRHGEGCKRRATCTYAHTPSERVCFYCAYKGDHIGRDCPQRRIDQEDLTIRQSGRGAPIEWHSDSDKISEMAVPKSVSKGHKEKNAGPDSANSVKNQPKFKDSSITPKKKQEPKTQRTLNTVAEISHPIAASEEPVEPTSTRLPTTPIIQKQEEVSDTNPKTTQPIASVLPSTTPEPVEAILPDNPVDSSVKETKQLSTSPVLFQPQKDHIDVQGKLDLVLAQNVELKKEMEEIKKQHAADMADLSKKLGMLLFQNDKLIEHITNLSKPASTSKAHASAPQTISSVNASASARQQNTGMFSHVNAQPNQMNAANGQGRR